MDENGVLDMSSPEDFDAILAMLGDDPTGINEAMSEEEAREFAASLGFSVED